MRYVTNDIVLRIEDWERRHPFVVHELESCCQGLVAATYGQLMSLRPIVWYSLDGQNLLLPYVQIFE